MGNKRNITVSAPGKIHLLGEHSVVYGKPAILAAINLRVKVTISPLRHSGERQRLQNPDPGQARMTEIIEPIIKKKFRIKKIPPYHVNISSKLPIGSGLGASAAISAAYIGALLTFLKIKWDKQLVNELTFEAEKIFHGNPSSGDNSIIVYGGLIWFRKETSDLRIIQPLNIKFSRSKNLCLIQTGIPKETTAEMMRVVSSKFKMQSAKFKKIFDDQERLVKELLPVLKDGHEKEFIRIIRESEKNLESIGVVSKSTQSIIRKIEKLGGAAKISGAGGKNGPSGILLCYHKDRKVVENIAKSYNLPYFSAKLGVEGLRKEL